MARTRRIKKDGDAHYHVMSRTNGKAFLFGDDAFKRRMVELLERAAAFSGVELEAHCMMDNHFHAVVHVEVPDEPVSEEEVIRRIGVLKGETYAADLAEHWAELRTMDMALVVDAQLACWRRRMHDVSQFVKTYKELVTIAYKALHPFTGSIWSGRFASTLVEDGQYLATCVRYVELNPVRAGIVSRTEDYAHCSHNTVAPLQCVSPAGTVPAGSAAGAGRGGTVPAGAMAEGRLLRRVAQIGAGKLFGSRDFVAGMIERFSERFASGRVLPRHVADGAFASHGHRVAA